MKDSKESKENLSKKVEIEIIYKQEKASFIRRGIAYFLDLLAIGLISIPVIFCLILILSSINPNKYENPITQIKEAIKTEKNIKTEKSIIIPLGKPIKQEKDNKEKENIIIGMEFNWVQEVIITYLYFTLCFFFWEGKTFGKDILGLKVIKQDGSKLTLWSAFERTHGYAASTLMMLLGFFQMLWDKEGLTLHDKIADTTVLRIKKIKIKKKIKPGKEASEKSNTKS
ncbi:MAG: RDD family protein [Candidatus Aminicenantia bacterium]